MYSEKIILRNLESFAEKNGWFPTYHSLEQVNEFKAYIDSITATESNSKNSYISVTKTLTEKRVREIRRWIENEQVICGLDSNYWESRYAYICDEKGQIFKFKNRKSQDIFDSVIADFDERQVSIELLILKARQVGITAKTALKFIHRLMFIPHTQAVMASVEAEKSQLIGRILDIAYNRCPWWLVPGKLPKKMYDNGSILSIQSGSQATGIAQGWTPTCVHISELCDLRDAKKVIEEGLLRATHSSRNLFLVFESTGGGNTGWLADTWRTSKADYPKGTSRLCPIFIPWVMATDLYPEADWIRKFPIPEGFMSSHRLEITMKHVARCESYIRNTPYLAKVAGSNWRMPPEQQWFWQFNYNQAVKNHTQKIWLTQMAADDFEALTGKHDSIFEPEIIDEIENRVYEVISGTEKIRIDPIQSYAITGHDIDDVFDPADNVIDYDKDSLQVVWNSHRGQHYEWTMVPLLPQSEAEEIDTMDRLLLFEKPRRGASYACGIDTADGLGKEDEERSVISVTRTGKDAEADVQVAEYTTNKLNSAQITAFAACIGALFSPYCPDSRGVKFIIEQVRGPGDTCQHQLKMMGFPYHHDPQRYDGKKIKGAPSMKQGWYSNAWSVPMLMTRFVEAVSGGWYIPKSRWLIEELRTLERHITSGKSKMVHRSGHFDDRARAAAQSYFTMHDMDVLSERAQKRYSGTQKKKPKKHEPRSTGNMSVGDWD